MPMIARLILAAMLLAATALPASAQGGAGGPSKRRIDVLVPAPQASAPRTIGPGRRGAIGRPKMTGKLLVELDIVTACNIGTGDADVRVHCSSDIPFRTEGPSAPMQLAANVPHRLTVDY